MGLLITGSEQGLGAGILKAVSSSMDIKAVKNIEGDEIWQAEADGCLKEFIDETIGDFNPTIVINNFGINHLSWIGETPSEDSSILGINVMAPYWIINKLVSNGSTCRVVNISSQTYRVAQRTTSLYCASKAALVQMTRVMARELASEGWVINSFCPGKIIGTQMTRLTDEQVEDLRGWDTDEADEYAKSMIPEGRFMSVEVAAGIVVNILLMNSYVNGVAIEAMGGV